MRCKMDRSKVVVVLEDDQVVRDLLASVLQDRGYYVVPVESGGRALEVLQQVRARLLILDLQLPDMNGNDVLRALRADEKTSDVKAMIVSGHMNMLKRDGSHQISQLVDKPFDVEQVVSQVEDLIGKAQAEPTPLAVDRPFRPYLISARQMA